MIWWIPRRPKETWMCSCLSLGSALLWTYLTLVSCDVELCVLRCVLLIVLLTIRPMWSESCVIYVIYVFGVLWRSPFDCFNGRFLWFMSLWLNWKFEGFMISRSIWDLKKLWFRNLFWIWKALWFYVFLGIWRVLWFCYWEVYDFVIEEFYCFVIDLWIHEFYDFDFDLKKARFSMILLLTCFGIYIWKLIKTTLWDFWKVL